jgi:alcohol dehydrogenase class IV
MFRYDDQVFVNRIRGAAVGASAIHDEAASAVAYRHATPSFRVFAGSAALQPLPRELARLKADRVLVVTDPALVAQGNALATLEEALGDSLVARFSEVAPHSPLPSVAAATDAMWEHGANGVIVLGGGSAVVTARAAVILHGEQRDVRDLCTHRAPNGDLVSPKLRAAKVPMWVVPSTPTAAYAKAGAAVRDPETGERLALFDPASRAQGIFLDPGVALTAPTGLVQSAALNAFAMAVESLQANRHDAIADALLAHAVRLLSENLPAALSDPNAADARLHLMTGALLSGQGTDFVGGGLAQALAHAIGPRSRAANGIVEAILLPHTIRFNGVADPRRLSLIAAALGEHAAAAPTADVVADLVAARLAGWQSPLRLREVADSRSSLDDAAVHAMDDWAITQAPRAPALEDVHRLLDEAW